MVTPLLDSLEIHGFRGFRHFRIDRLGRLNLIVGRNNTGKTSLLEALWLYVCGGSPSAIWEILEMRDEARRPPRRKSLVFPGRDDVRDPSLALRHLIYGKPDLRKRLESIRIGPVGSAEQMLTLTPGWSVYETVGGRLHLRSVNVVDVNLTQDAVLSIQCQKGSDLIAEFRMTSDSFSFQSGAGPGSSFVPSSGFDLAELAKLWDGIALTSLETEVVGALKILQPDVERVSLLTDPGRENEAERVPKVKLANRDEPVLLRSLGDGMNRLFGMALALVTAKSRILLIDEIENGLHYSVQKDVWRLVFETAARLDAQVFATTHSWDCISAFQAAASESNEEGMLVRLQEKDAETTATLFDRRRLGIASQEDIEIR